MPRNGLQVKTTSGQGPSEEQTAEGMKARRALYVDARMQLVRAMVGEWGASLESGAHDFRVKDVDVVHWDTLEGSICPPIFSASVFSSRVILEDGMEGYVDAYLRDDTGLADNLRCTAVENANVDDRSVLCAKVSIVIRNFAYHCLRDDHRALMDPRSKDIIRFSYLVSEFPRNKQNVYGKVEWPLRPWIPLEDLEVVEDAK